MASQASARIGMLTIAAAVSAAATGGLLLARGDEPFAVSGWARSVLALAAAFAVARAVQARAAARRAGVLLARVAAGASLGWLATALLVACDRAGSTPEFAGLALLLGAVHFILPLLAGAALLVVSAKLLAAPDDRAEGAEG